MKKTLIVAAFNAAYFAGTGALLYSTKLQRDATAELKKQTSVQDDIAYSLRVIAKR